MWTLGLFWTSGGARDLRDETSSNKASIATTEDSVASVVRNCRFGNPKLPMMSANAEDDDHDDERNDKDDHDENEENDEIHDKMSVIG